MSMDGFGCAVQRAYRNICIQVWEDYQTVLTKETNSSTIMLGRVSRKEFYQRTREAYATIQTADPRAMADIIIRKGFVFSDLSDLRLGGK